MKKFKIKKPEVYIRFIGRKIYQRRMQHFLRYEYSLTYTLVQFDSENRQFKNTEFNNLKDILPSIPENELNSSRNLYFITHTNILTGKNHWIPLNNVNPKLISNERST